MAQSVYQIVTDRIIESLEAGVKPWSKPWNCSTFSVNGKSFNGPVNAVTLKPYRGINTILLGMTTFKDPRFLTFNQAKALGGSVKKGERGSIIVFWKWVDVKQADGDANADSSQQAGKRVPILRYYTVFNVEQCENLTKLKALEILAPHATEGAELHEAAEAVLAGIRNPVKAVYHGGNAAFYSPEADIIQMPNVASFNSLEGYYATRFHEEAHATGHASRLNRLTAGKFGSEVYAREELVAEMTAAFLCAVVGVDASLDQSAAYISGWLKKLKDDPKFVVIAAGQAQKAADYIIGDNAEEDTAE